MSKTFELAKTEPQTEPTIEELEKTFEADRYTSIFFQKKPSYYAALLVVSALFLFIGGFHGYQRSIHLTLQSQHVSMEELSRFSFSTYPYLFKVLFAPFIDRFYFKAFGKSKTYIVACGLLIAGIFYGVSPFMEDLVNTNQVNSIIWILILLNTLMVFFQVSASIWILTLFQRDQKTKASFLKVIAVDMGEILTFNLFVPLNSVRWINTYLYPVDSQISDPLFKHSHVCLGLASFILVIAVMLSLFASEKKISHENEIKLSKVFSYIPKLVSQPNMFKLLAYMAACRIPFYLIAEIVSYKVFLKFGITKSTIVMIDTLLIPMAILVSLLCHKFVHKGQLLKVGHWMTLMGLMAIFGKYIILLTVPENSQNNNLVIALIFLMKLALICAVAQNCYTAYFVHIVEERTSGTSMSILLAFITAIHLLPKTAGLQLADLLNFDHLVCGTMILHFAMIIFFYRSARYLDTLTDNE